MSFEEFVLENYGNMVRSVALAFGDRPRAEDAVQEAFAKAYRSWRRVAHMDRPDRWVYVVACNAARRAHRKELRDVGPARELDDPIDPLVSAMDVERALDELTARQRAAVVLRYLADLPIDDIARALDCEPGTVKATLHQSLQRLRIEMEARRARVNVDELRRALDEAAGSPPPAEPAHAVIVALARRRTRRHRRGIAVLVTALVVTVVGLAVAGLDDPAQKVTTDPPDKFGASSSGSTTTTRAVPDGVRDTLDAWSSFPVDADPRPLVLAGIGGSPDLVNAPARGFPDDGTKNAYESGQFDVAVPLPTAPTTSGEHPLVTGQEILDRFRSSGSPGPLGPGPLTITSIELGEAEFTTDRGRQPLPAWLVTFAGISDPAQVLAIAPEGVFPGPPLVSIEHPSTAVPPEAATISGDRTLSVSFTGKGPQPGFCGGDYELDVYESDHAVAVAVREVPREVTTTTGVVFCTLKGYGRTLTAELRLPLGARVVVDAATRAPLTVSR